MCEVWGEDTEFPAWVTAQHPLWDGDVAQGAAPAPWPQGQPGPWRSGGFQPSGVLWKLHLQLRPRGQGWMSPVSQRLTWLQPQALVHPGIESESLEERGRERRLGLGGWQEGDAPSAALIPLCALPRRVPVTASALLAAVTSSRVNPEVS